MTSNDDIHGLLLVGGQSSRMGTDKAAIEYHGRPHAEHLFELMKKILPKVYVSVREGQKASFTDEVIQDQFPTKGPINGILSAMDRHPDKAWLVLAVDLPFVDEGTIKQLIQMRDPAKMATAFATNESGLPEPLIAIWEPNALESLKQHHLEEDKNCPRKFLINNNVELVKPKSDQELYNANSPEEYQQAKNLIG